MNNFQIRAKVTVQEPRALPSRKDSQPKSFQLFSRLNVRNEVDWIFQVSGRSDSREINLKRLKRIIDCYANRGKATLLFAPENGERADEGDLTNMLTVFISDSEVVSLQQFLHFVSEKAKALNQPKEQAAKLQKEAIDSERRMLSKIREMRREALRIEEGIEPVRKTKKQLPLPRPRRHSKNVTFIRLLLRQVGEFLEAFERRSLKFVCLTALRLAHYFCASLRFSALKPDPDTASKVLESCQRTESLVIGKGVDFPFAKTPLNKLNFRYLRTLDIAKCLNITSDVILKILFCAPRLTVIKLPFNAINRPLLQTIRRLYTGKVSVLKFKMNGRIPWGEFFIGKDFIEIMEENPQISSLQFYELKFSLFGDSDVESPFWQLTSFKVRTVFFDSKHDLCSQMVSFFKLLGTSLVKLNIVFMEHSSRAPLSRKALGVLASIVEGLPALKSFTFGCFIDSLFFCSVLEIWRKNNVKVRNVRVCWPGLTDDHLRRLLASQGEIRKLKLAFCNRITEQGILGLQNGLELSLQEVRIDYTDARCGAFQLLSRVSGLRFKIVRSLSS